VRCIARCSPRSRPSPACRCASTSAWSPTARARGSVLRATRTKGEVKASTDAIANGAKRGNPAPKYAASIAASGSGGLFGALAPYVAWTGLDEDYTPYIDEDWPIIEDPIVAAICAAKYYQRIVGGGRYPVFANPAQAVPRGQLPRAARMGEPDGAQGEPERRAVP
jgi:hypothetical protein